MRVSVSGTSNTGKSTLIKNIQMIWKNYKTPDKSYRDFLTKEELEHSKKTTPETQRRILDCMIDQQMSESGADKILYDRCPLDNLAYTLYMFSKGKEGFNKSYVDETITLVKESMRNLDIIFLLRYDDSIGIEDDGTREADVKYIKEIDNIFHALYEQYLQNPEADIFFPKHDTPVIIPLPTSPKGRIEEIKNYLDESGELYGEEHSLFTPENLDNMEKLLKQQQNALDSENAEKELYKKFGLAPEQDPNSKYLVNNSNDNTKGRSSHRVIK